MNRNIEALLTACDRLGLSYQSHHKTGNLISVLVNGRCYPFVNWTTPLNPQSVMKLCQDKDYFYTFYRDVVQMPQTRSFLNPYTDDKYAEYLSSNTIFGIVAQIETAFSYPLIVKKNRGSWGSNVFKVTNRRELEKGLLDIFNMSSSRFDYIGLAQAFIDVAVEYRVVFLQGVYQFAYEKIGGEGQFAENLSPLHTAGSKAQYVTDETVKKALIDFCAPLFNKLMIPFCGLDIARDKQGELWLIEANSSPGFDHIIKHEGEERVVQLYETMLTQHM